MARQLPLMPESTDSKNDLSTLIPKYGNEKAQFDILEKQVKADNGLIKTLMAEIDANEFEAGGYIAKVSTQNRESFNEEALLDLLKRLKMKQGIVKKREYVDMDALENAIYHGLINAADLQSAQVVKEVITLRVTAVKEKKE